MRVCLMIEGQEDVTWEDWVALAGAAERNGFDALFRSDHYLSVAGELDRGSLDAWGTICGLSAITRTLRLGTMVSPASFRHPSVLAKAVVTADRISGGRVELGIGTGWLEAEHAAYGFPFPPIGARMDRLAEQLEIIRGSWGEGPFSFRGEHYEPARSGRLAQAGAEARAAADLRGLRRPAQRRAGRALGGRVQPRLRRSADCARAPRQARQSVR